jgi:anthranilate synthase/aminodeoxychorismate synthase-like glutamine amidotransferase
MILLIDNYDSFVYNLARYFRRLGYDTSVVRNDATDAATVVGQRPEAIVISPGPCTPQEAGCSVDLIQKLGECVPILGICLGHQAIAAAFGGRIVRAATPMHGRASGIYHNGGGIFSGVPNPLTGCRYHSLVVEERSLPDRLEVSARTASGVVMAIRHRGLPIVGLQFHPESALTDAGYCLLVNFLRMARLPLPNVVPSIEDEVREKQLSRGPLPRAPVTF